VLTPLLKEQQDRLERRLDSWTSEYRHAGGHIFCDKGCANCCTLAVHTTFIEARAIAERLDTAQIANVDHYLDRLRSQLSNLTDLKSYLKIHRQVIGPCPFLDPTGACSIYTARPLACRALLATRPADWCSVDFAALDPWDLKSFQTGLDQKVVAWPSHYVATTQDWARQAEDQLQDEMATRFGVTLSGNLPLLVWMQHNHQLDRLLVEEPATIASLLEDCDLQHPMLLEFCLL
jgi:Fe-S-cluster containining protein